jgi:hypothetical protein
VNLERIDARVFAERYVPRSQIEAPGMPRTGDDGPFQPAFAERPTLMWTGVFDRIELSRDVEQRDFSISDDNRLPAPGRHLVGRRDGYEGHGSLCASPRRRHTFPAAEEQRC